MAKKLWGGRFSKKGMDPKVLSFTSSLDVDIVLAKYDCLGTIAHVEMLKKCGYISAGEKKKLVTVLKGLIAKIEKGTWAPEGAEDVHSAVQAYVEEKAPKAAVKMHTARSRNEQVVCDVRLYAKDSVKRVTSLVKDLQKALVKLAGKTKKVIIPGYTHLNRAQPVLFAHLLLAYAEMLDRDKARLADAGRRCDVSVMGSGALAGSSLKLDRKLVADKLGFAKVSANSIDAVSDRDFVAEAVFALAMTSLHLSRISEDLILYSTPEFGFIGIGEAYCTGSSLMPQKKNPDVLELIRGKSASVVGSLNALLALVKGLPHSYNRDLQEDKKPFFESVETVASSLEMMTGVISTLEVDKEAAAEALEDEFIYATDIAEYLVKKGVAFREAHDVVGKIVRHCVVKDINISDLSLGELEKFAPELGKDVYLLLDAKHSVSAKKTPGSTSPGSVENQIKSWKKRTGK